MGEMSDIRILVEAYLDVQEDRKRAYNRMLAYNRMKVKTPHGAWTVNEFKQMEEKIKKRLVEAMKDHPVMSWIKGVKGVKEVLASQLVAIIGDVSRFPTISSLWKMCGLHVETRCEKCGKRYFKNDLEKEQFIEKMVNRLRAMHEKRKEKTKFDEEAAKKKVLSWICHCKDPKPVNVAPRRRRGELLDWNPKARMICWKIATQLLKIGKRTNSKWWQLYQQYREYYKKRGDAKNDYHVHNRALRRIMKLFVACLWLVWREVEGLPTRPPYAIEKLQHTHYIDPWELTEK